MKAIVYGAFLFAFGYTLIQFIAAVAMLFSKLGAA